MDVVFDFVLVDIVVVVVDDEDDGCDGVVEFVVGDVVLELVFVVVAVNGLLLLLLCDFATLLFRFVGKLVVFVVVLVVGSDDDDDPLLFERLVRRDFDFFGILLPSVVIFDTIVFIFVSIASSKCIFYILYCIIIYIF